jgi:hypothetical protein
VIPKFKILVGIEGLPDRSEYDPLVATVANEGLPDRSEYDPLVATVANEGLPDKSAYAPDVATVANVGFPVTFVQVRLDDVIKPAPLVN